MQGDVHGLPGHRFRVGGGAAGIERLEATLLGEAFAPHRHDTYAVGITLAGVQTFRYRGERRHCLPGQWHVLHPDEVHDGAPANDDGFSYRIIYLDPALVLDALGAGTLPFVADPVISAPTMPLALSAFLTRIDEPLDELEAAEVTTVVADALHAHADAPLRTGTVIDVMAMRRVRELLMSEPTRRYRADEIETVTGMNRWSAARQFRAAFGTSPSRFRTMRQLDLARTLIRGGHRLADVASMAGFADQAHLTRMFKQAYGLTPAVWSAAVA
ncbi:AraC family transcriptional regulator [Phytoactinopolyspora alkaliphila]|uniref:AraC family transcriptional regulator n=1 Tax=Phytoactinopolyspora alkaliphila TaxID=1783498 RepID=A0A6N9YS06_9ACTN|nr:AraC family transcriptional regulator [Phytoactinopolyspora alkaliphila]NED97727.1 AraC family transcriptional regulator [Phytoactinopolyspora alkaliphila]